MFRALAAQTYLCLNDFSGRSSLQSDSLDADSLEPHATGERVSDVASEGGFLSEQERRWEQRPQTADLPDGSERTESGTCGEDRPDQISS